MTDKKPEDTQKLLWMLGIALTLPMILAAGPIAGYLIGFWLVRNFDTPGFVIPLCSGIGLLGSGLQAYQLIRKLNNRS